jgi:hypothetical protein
VQAIALAGFLGFAFDLLNVLGFGHGLLETAQILS